MDIIDIYPPFLYSIKFDDREENEFDRLFQLWNDVSFVTHFIDANREFLCSPFWQTRLEPEDAARQVLDEAEALEELFEDLYQNILSNEKPDFDSHFHYLDGKYKYVLEWQPMKSYGTTRPSLLRIYAIKMGVNTYLITGGGIKLAETIQNSPDLKDHVIQDIDRIRTFLKDNGIMDSDDMENQN